LCVVYFARIVCPKRTPSKQSELMYGKILLG
jgi:hypothetical protein